MTTHDTRSPEEIENEIERTQDDMSRTIDRLGDQFTPRNLVNALFDKAEENDIQARALLDGARRNPLALGLLSAGAIWLVSDYDAHPKTFRSGTSKGGWDNNNFPELDTSYERDHRSYVDHMSKYERRDGEDDLTYRRRRDDARATFLMIERGDDEDESSFRKRLDAATDQLRKKRDEMADQARSARDDAIERARSVKDQIAQGSRHGANRVARTYNNNPVLGGVIAAMAGLIAGSATPATPRERQVFGDTAERAVDKAKQQGERLASEAKHAKDEALGKAQERIEPSETDRKEPETIG
ncbi:MAG: DUF3618 domain-containing protein [Parvularcula sp.]|nr:DUF3618 domain-containing protein [Parvularcula sp.]